MVLLRRVGNILGLSPPNRQDRWWPAGLLALTVPLAIWLATTSIVSPPQNDALAGEFVSEAEAGAVSIAGRATDVAGKTSCGLPVEIPSPDEAADVSTLQDVRTLAELRRCKEFKVDGTRWRARIGLEDSGAEAGP